MKILAIEKDIENEKWGNSDNILKQEAKKVYQLYLSGSLREVYFSENKNAVLILEAENKQMAEKLLSSLPLVKENMIQFEIIELRPYTGYERLMENYDRHSL